MMHVTSTIVNNIIIDVISPPKKLPKDVEYLYIMVKLPEAVPSAVAFYIIKNSKEVAKAIADLCPGKYFSKISRVYYNRTPKTDYSFTVFFQPKKVRSTLDYYDYIQFKIR